MCDRAGFLQVVACVDGCHIPIKAPQSNPEDYVNRKGFHSIILQGLVEANYLFLDVCVGWPGKVHSSLYMSLCGHGFTQCDSGYDTINGARVPQPILGDSVYPLQIPLFALTKG